MSKLSSLGVLGACLLYADGYSRAATPVGLYGKSIVVSWEEVRDQRDVGKTKIYNTKASSTLIIYIGTAGHVFRKFVVKYPNGHVTGGEAVEGIGQDARRVIFGGHSLTIFAPFGGGIRRIIVNFSRKYDKCTASFTYAKQPGVDIPRMYDQVDKDFQDIFSVSFSHEQCASQEGNALVRP